MAEAAPKARARPAGTRAPEKKPRASGLSRERIVAATIDFLRSNPDQQLTMARAGAAVGATAMAIYRHFEDGADLADAILASVFEGLEDRIPPDGDWKEQTRAWMEDIYRRLLETPQCVEILNSSNGSSAAWMRTTAVLHRCLSTSGMDGPVLAEALFYISITMRGFVRQTVALPLDEAIIATIASIKRLPAEDQAYLLPVAEHYPAIYRHAVEFMVERTLASIEALRAQNATTIAD